MHKPYELSKDQIALVNNWLTCYAHKDDDGWYDDCQLTDDCVYDLGLQDQNNHVYELVLDYIRTH